MANRGMSAAMLTEIAKSEVVTCLLVEMYFDGGTLRFTDAYMDLDWSGNTYSSAGNFLAVTGISESYGNEIPMVNVALSGVPAANISVAFNEEHIDRNVIIRRAYLDAAYTVISDPLELFNGNISAYPTIRDNRGSSSIEWKVSSHWADFERVAGRRTNNEDQQVIYPGDTFFLFASEIIKDAPWGRPDIPNPNQPIVLINQGDINQLRF